MRTKVLLCAAAMAVGLSAMAQVYSLNVVGYYNVTVINGKTLIANQLNNGTNGINQVLPSVADGSLVLKFANNTYNTDIFTDAGSGPQWYDNGTGLPSTTTLKPGEGFFYDNPGSTTTLTFVGEVPQGTVTVGLPPGKALVSTATPQALELSAANNFPQVDGTLYLSFANNVYWTGILTDAGSGIQWYDNGTGLPTTLIPAVGQGYFIDNPGTATTWSRNFTVQ